MWASRLEDLARSRRLIEGAVLELAAARLTEEDFRALRAANENYARIARRRGSLAVDEAIEANYSFHFRLYGACGSPAMMRIVESLWLQSGAIVRCSVEAFRRDDAISAIHFHAAIVDALERGDVAGAKEALADDISRAFALCQRALFGGGDPRDRRRRFRALSIFASRLSSRRAPKSIVARMRATISN